jgi:hypothetical protein
MDWPSGFTVSTKILWNISSFEAPVLNFPFQTALDGQLKYLRRSQNAT